MSDSYLSSGLEWPGEAKGSGDRAHKKAVQYNMTVTVVITNRNSDATFRKLQCKYFWSSCAGRFLRTAAMELITQCKSFQSRAFVVNGHTLPLTGGIPLQLKFTLWEYSGPTAEKTPQM